MDKNFNPPTIVTQFIKDNVEKTKTRGAVYIGCNVRPRGVITRGMSSQYPPIKLADSTIPEYRGAGSKVPTWEKIFDRSISFNGCPNGCGYRGTGISRNLHVLDCKFQIVDGFFYLGIENNDCYFMRPGKAIKSPERVTYIVRVSSNRYKAITRALILFPSMKLCYYEEFDNTLSYSRGE